MRTRRCTWSACSRAPPSSSPTSCARCPFLPPWISSPSSPTARSLPPASCASARISTSRWRGATCSWWRGSARAGSASPISSATSRRAAPPPSRPAPSWPSAGCARPTSPSTTWGARSPTSSWLATASTRRSGIATCPTSRVCRRRVTMAPGHMRARPSRRAGRILLVLVLLAASTASAEDPEVADTIVKRGRIASDLYAFGGGVDVDAEVNGDLIAGGGRVTVSHTVRGDLLVGAGSVMVGGLVERNVRAAGGAVTFAGRVGRNIDVAGGTITIEPEATIGGGAQLVGGELHVAGPIGRRLRAAGAVVVLAGEITGNVEVVAQEIEVRPTARLRGKLTYWSPEDARIAPEAIISGRVI